MKRTGPLLTLVAGLIVAGVLLVLSGVAASDDRTDAAARTDVTTAAATPSLSSPPSTPLASPPPAPPPPSASPSATAAGIRASYAGKVDGRTATVAIAVADGKAVAYLCDGKRLEAWLQGTAVAGVLDLKGKNGAFLRGTYDRTGAKGEVSADGKRWTFTVRAATAPSGLYRATAKVRDAKIVGGWIVLADGTQVGIVTSAGVPVPSSPLDVAAGRATVGGTPLTAAPVDGTTRLG